METNLKDVVLHQFLGAPVVPWTNSDERAPARPPETGECLVLQPARVEIRLSRPRRVRSRSDVLMIC